ELLLELAVRPVGADDQPRRGRPRAARRRPRGCLDDSRMRSEPEVVVRREVEQPPTVLGDDVGPGTLECAQRTEVARAYARLQLVGEKRLPVAGYNAHSSISNPRSSIIR